MTNTSNSFLTSAIKQFEYYKSLGEQTFLQINESQLFWQANDQSNSISMIVQHLSGNMLSRFTNFLTEDGEKEWRKRDDEFEVVLTTKHEVLNCWNNGWQCILNSIEQLQPTDTEKIIFIRNQGHTVTEAINRQLCHYSYHIGQIVFIGKMISNNDWQSLSIPKGESQLFNAKKFAKEKEKKHFAEK